MSHFYPRRRHDTCIETHIMHNRESKPYYFCGDNCPTNVKDAAAELREFIDRLRTRGIDVWADGQDIYVGELGRSYRGPYELLEES